MAYTVHQAKTNFSRLLKEAEAGKEVIVLRGKKPVARLVPIEMESQSKRIPGGFEGLALADDKVFDPLSDEELAEYGFGLLLDGEEAESGKARHERLG